MSDWEDEYNNGYPEYDGSQDYDGYQSEQGAEFNDGYQIVDEYGEQVDDIDNVGYQIADDIENDWETAFSVDISGSGSVIPNSAAIDFRYDQTGQLASDKEWNPTKQESYIINKAQRELEKLEATSVSPDERMGKMTAADLQLGRFSHMEASVRLATIDFLTGFDNLGLSPLHAEGAREKFGALINMSAGDFARQIIVDPSEIPSEITSTNSITGNSETISRPYDSKAQRLAVGMVKDTAGYYLEKGVGERLAGQGTSKQIAEAEMELQDALADVKDITDLYIHDNTIGSEVEGARRKAVENAVIQRALHGTFGEDASSILALPNELGVLGVKPTLSFRGFSGTKFDRLGFSKEAEKRGWVYGTETFFEHMPNIKSSLFGKIDSSDEDSVRMRDYKHQEAVDKMQRIRKVLRKNFPTHRDESAGQDNTSGWDKSYNEQSIAQDAWDLAASLGYDMERPDLNPNMKSSHDKVGVAHSYEKPKPIITKAELVGPLIQYANDRPIIETITEVQGPPKPRQTFFNDNLIAAKATGSEEGGMYGAKGLSEVDQFVQNYISNPSLEKLFKDNQATYTEDTPSEFVRWQLENNFAFGEDFDFGDATLQQAFLEQRDDWVSEGIKQRTPEWYAARRGMVTASSLIDKKGKKLSPEQLAMQLATAKLGLDDFIGNDYTEVGNKGEKKALEAFLNQQKSSGSPLTHKDVGLITNENFKGMGVSPDGRLYNEKGESQGLLELKYLTDISDKNTKKYDHQMQMQMMITGETQTHFFALDRYTHESANRIVKADPAYQARLKKEIEEALTISEGLDTASKIVDFEEKVMAETASQRSGKTPKDTSGQTASADVSKSDHDPITPFRAPKDRKGSKKTDVAAYFRSLDQSQRKKALNRGFDSVEDMVKFDEAEASHKEAKKLLSGNPNRISTAESIEKSTGITSSREFEDPATYYRSLEQNDRKKALDKGYDTVSAMEQAKAEEAITAEQKAKDKEEDRLKKEADKELLDAAKARAAADKEVVKTTKAFQQTLSETAKGLKAFAEGSNKTSMDTIRLAAESGLDAESARGIERALEEGGLSLDAAKSTISSAGQMQATFNDVSKVGAAYTNLSKAWAGADLDDTFGPLKSIEEFKGMSVPEIIAYGQDLMDKAETPEQRAQVGRVLNLQKLTTSRASSEEILEKGIINVDGAYSFNEALTEVKNTLSTAGESVVNFTGSMGGYAAAGLGAAGVGMKAYTTIKGVRTAKAAMDNAKTNPNAKTPASTSSKFKGMASNIKANAKYSAPLLAAAAGRSVLDIKDDGGFADSMMDVAEFAAAGAVFGPAGAAAGAVIGAGHEVGEALGLWDNSDAVPDKSIADKPTAVQKSDTKVSNVNEIDVNVVVDSEVVKTRVRANGEDYSDTEMVM